MQYVGRRQEDDLRKIIGHFQVVIGEGVVLFEIEYLEQGCRWVAPVIAADLVDFVQHEERVERAGRLHGLEYAPRQRADVGAAMPAYLGLVMHAAQREPHELATKRRGDGTPK